MKNLFGIPSLQSEKDRIETEINRLRRVPRPDDKDDFRDDVVGGMKALQEIGKPAVPRLIELLLDENEWVGFRARVAGTLADIGDKAAMEPLIQSLDDPDAFMRWNVVKALEQIGDLSAIPELERLAAEDKGEFLIARFVTTVKEAAEKAILKIKSK